MTHSQLTLPVTRKANRLQCLRQWLSSFGIDAIKFRCAIKVLPVVIREYDCLKRQNRQTGSRYKLRFTLPCLHDRQFPSGTASGHYFHQDLLVAKRILQGHPTKHVDVGSRIDGFVAHVATFRTIEVLDIRPLDTHIPNVIFRQCDVMNCRTELTNYCDSISCLHALEHFGLGRYGDPIDIDGHIRGFDSLHKILQPNGTLYLSVPIGQSELSSTATGFSQSKQYLKWRNIASSSSVFHT